MFTGIIHSVSKITKTQKSKNALTFFIAIPKGWKLKLGQSVAVNGVCLTVAKLDGKNFCAEIMTETLNKTSFGKTIPAEVNLERSLAVGDRLDGHFVLGHVDAVGKIKKVVCRELDRVYYLEYPKQFSRFVVSKGSITINGVSLTIITAKPTMLGVALVGYTLRHTNLGKLKEGSLVNLEFDVLAKYIVNKKK